MGDHPDPRFTSADAKTVKEKAKQVIGQFGFIAADLEDLQQEVAMHVFQHTHRHDPTRGSREAFVGTTAKNKLLHMAEAKTAKKRDDRSNIEYGDAPDSALIDGSLHSSQLDLHLEMRSLADSLPPEQRAVYDLMLQGYVEADIQKYLRIGRQRVRNLIRRVEARIREANLGRYVASQPEED